MKWHFLSLFVGSLLLLVNTVGNSQTIDNIDPPKVVDTSAAEKYLLVLYDQTINKEDGEGYESRRVVHPIPQTADQETTPAILWPSILNALKINFEDTAHPLITPGKSLVCLDNEVVIRDVDNGRDVVLVRGEAYQELGFARVMTRAVISPDGTRIAATVFRGIDERPKKNPLFDIHIYDAFGDRSKSKLVASGIAGDMVMGSGFLPAAGPPPIFWAQNDSLLVVKPKPYRLEDTSEIHFEREDEPTVEELAKLADSMVVFKSNVLTPTYDLIEIDVDNGTVLDVCELKTFTLNSFSNGADFWRRSDGAIMLRSSGTDIRVDLVNRQAISDRRLSPLFELRGDRYRPSLWFGDVQLAKVIHFRDVSVSPDGNSVAWFARTNELNVANLGNTSQFNTTLWYHSEATGSVKLAEGYFESSTGYLEYDNPVLNPRLRWLKVEDLNSRDRNSIP